MLKTSFLGLVFCVASLGFAQENPLAGAIDIHVHAAPDSTPRSIDAIDLARLAKSRGMRGLVLKNHLSRRLRWLTLFGRRCQGSRCSTGST